MSTQRFIAAFRHGVVRRIGRRKQIPFNRLTCTADRHDR